MKTILTITLTILTSAAQAQAVENYQEYSNRLRVSQISAYGDDLFGEDVSLYTGQAEFRATDISLPGNSQLPVELTRRFKVEQRRQTGYLGGFGVWDIEVPHLHGVFQQGIGWAASSGGRCSSGNGPATSSNWFTPDEILSGAFMHLPGQSDRELLRNVDPKRQVPSDGQAYPWATEGYYQIRCIAMSNNYGGEGFLAVSPEGVKYFFNYGYEVGAMTLSVSTEGVTDFGAYVVPRRRIFLLATRVEDRFGNYVNYAYNQGKLVSIVANDGRQIALTYSSGRVAQATTGTRTWTYQYTNSQLTSVTQPDGSSWQYQAASYAFSPAYDPSFPLESAQENCIEPGLGQDSFNLRITHPSGAVGNFNFEFRREYRTGTPADCVVRIVAGGYMVKNKPVTVYKVYQSLRVPNFWDIYRLSYKSIAGPGVATRRWDYDYEGYDSGVSTEPGDGIGGVLAKTVLVVDPIGESSTYKFGVTYKSNEGRLLEQKRLDANGIAKATTIYTYLDDASASAMPFASTYGESWLENYDFASHRVRPILSRTIAQDGATFNSTVEAFNVFAMPGTVRKWSSLNHTRTDVTEYENNLTKWVLGQIKSTTCINGQGCPTAPTKITSAVYNSDALPVSVYSFGKLRQTLAYEATGSLSALTDGRGSSTKLSDWHRGVPRLIRFPITTGYPAGATKSAVVDSNGWIASVTDELGSKTCFEYDAMGRLAGTTYPSEVAAGVCDVSTWVRSTSSTAQIAHAEYGVAAGHWKRIDSTGTGRETTIFNAYWQPVLSLSEDTTNSSTKSYLVTRYDLLRRRSFQSYALPTLFTVDDSLPGTLIEYDALGREKQRSQTSELGGGSTKLTTVFESGFSKSVMDPRGNTTTTSFQAFDEPTESLPINIIRPEGVSTTIRRDVLGRPTDLSRSGLYQGLTTGATRWYAFDTGGMLCKIVNPESGATMLSYDSAGNLEWTADGQSHSGSATSCDYGYVALAERTTITRDAMGRVTAIATPGAVADATTAYEADGLPTKLTSQNPGVDVVTTTFGYNRRRLLTQEVLQVNSLLPWTFLYSYNGNGHGSSQTYPGNLVVGFAPNGLGQPTQAGAFATNVTHHPNGTISGFVYGNGIVHSMTKNARELPERSVDSYQGKTFLDDTYGYDANGNVTSVVDAMLIDSNNRSKTMTYDGIDRLLSANAPSQWGASVYSYDPLDNLRTSTLGSAGFSFNYDNKNRLSTLTRNGGGSYAYTSDAAGNITSDGRQVYQFDGANRLNAVVGKESYLYDGNGRRARTLNSVTGTIEYFGYGADGKLLQDWSNRRANRKAYVYLGGSLIATYGVTLSGPSQGAVNVQYHHTDSLGSPVAVTDAGRLIISRSSFSPYGIPLSPVDGVGYSGHVMDVGTGLTYMQQRYYDPQIGRFLSIDSVSTDVTTGANFARYSYAMANPFRYFDPDGRSARVLAGSGAPAEERVVAALAEDGIQVFRNVAITTKDAAGKLTTAVADYVYRRGDTLYFGEVKDGLQSKLSSNQKIVYSAIRSGKVAISNSRVAQALGVIANRSIGAGAGQIALHGVEGGRAWKQFAKYVPGGTRVVLRVAASTTFMAVTLVTATAETSSYQRLSDECPQCSPKAIYTIPDDD